MAALQGERKLLRDELSKVTASNQLWQTSNTALVKDNAKLRSQLDLTDRMANETDQRCLDLRRSSDSQTAQIAQLDAIQDELCARNQELKADLAKAVEGKRVQDMSLQRTVDESEGLRKELLDAREREKVASTFVRQFQEKNKRHNSQILACKRRVKALLDELALVRSQRDAAQSDPTLGALKECLQQCQARSAADRHSLEWLNHSIGWARTREEDAYDTAHIMAHQNEIAQTFRKTMAIQLSDSRNKALALQESIEVLKDEAKTAQNQKAKIEATMQDFSHRLYRREAQSDERASRAEQIRAAAESQCRQYISFNDQIRKTLTDEKAKREAAVHERDWAVWYGNQLKKEKVEAAAERERVREEASVERNEKAKELDELREKLKNLEEQDRTVKAGILISENVLSQERRQMEEASNEERNRFEDFRVESSRVREGLRRQVEHLEKALESERSKATENEQKMKKTTGELESSNEKLQNLQTALIDEKARSTDHKQTLARMTEDLNTSRLELQRLQNALADETEKLATSRAEQIIATEEVQSLETEMERLQGLVTKGETLLAEADSEITKLHQDKDNLRKNIQQMRKDEGTAVADSEQLLQNQEGELRLCKRGIYEDKWRTPHAEESFEAALKKDPRRKVPGRIRQRRTRQMVNKLGQPTNPGGTMGGTKARFANNNIFDPSRISFNVRGAATAVSPATRINDELTPSNKKRTATADDGKENENNLVDEQRPRKRRRRSNVTLSDDELLR